MQRWLDDVLATYSDEAAAAFGRQKDPFANPVGHCLRIATRGIFEALLEGGDAETIRPHLHEVMKVRAVQDFSASQAVGFVFQLKRAVRAELREELSGSGAEHELTEFDERIDEIALAAFDMFVECREQVYQIRVDEMKRRVWWVTDRLNRRDDEPGATRVDPK
ncbi:MAG: RsbRD N-terminal domain-containing protein [Pirellulales bacterium]|nr:RsbRD N-terminal domain-containing protein [Pirellulales bacterium]